MKAPVLVVALSLASLALASGHHANPNPGEHRMLRKRQALGNGANGQDATTPGSSAAAGSPAVGQGAASPSNVASASPSSSNNNSPLDSLTHALESSSSTAPGTTSAQDQSTAEQLQSQSTTSAAPSPSSSSTVSNAHSSSSNTPSSIVPQPGTSSASTGARPVDQSTVVSIITPSASATNSATDSNASASASSSAAASDKKSDSASSSSSSGGIGHGTLIAIIVVASCVAGVAAIWTIIRKTAFSPSKRFESKLEPIDFVPEVPEYGGVPQHHRSQSQLSGAYGAGGGPGYAASLARSDSKASLRGGGQMSESGSGLASIPYQGPGYSQQSYQGDGAYYGHGSPQLGYPHEQPTYYPALQRGLSSSSSLQHQAGGGGLNRMNTTATQSAGGIAYDYGAQARSQSRGPGGGGGHQYY